MSSVSALLLLVLIGLLLGWLRAGQTTQGGRPRRPSVSLRAWHAGRRGEAAVSRALRRRFSLCADDLILPDGRGGLTQIDHLALTPTGLLVVETKNHAGLIFGSASDRQWTKIIGRQRIAFHNPLRQNFAHTEAVRTLAPGLPRHGQALVAGTRSRRARRWRCC